MYKNLLLSTLFVLFLSALNGQTWQTSTSLPANARHHPVTFAIDNIGFVLTGVDVNNVFYDDFYQYDFDTDQWNRLANFPGGARGFSYGAALERKAYVGFGLGPNGLLNDLWEFDANTFQWTQLSSCPCAGRRHPAFLVIDDKIFVGLGDNLSRDLDDWWEYDIANDTWTQRDNLPGPGRHHPFFFQIDNVPHVGFGHSGPNIYKDFFKYDPVMNQWTQLQDFPSQGRVAGTQFDYNGKGYLLSGQDESHRNFSEGEFWEYDPTTDSWRQMPSHPGSSRWAPGSFVVDGVVHFLAGLSGFPGVSPDELKNDMMTFDLKAPTSNKEIAGKKAFSVYPNPTNGIFYISSFQDEPIEAIQVIDMQGSVVMNLSARQNHFQLENLSRGLYLVKITDSSGKHQIEKILLNN